MQSVFLDGTTPYILMSVSLSRSGNVVKKLSIALVDPLLRSHFSIIPRITSESSPNPVSGKSVLFQSMVPHEESTHLTSISTKV